MTKSEAELYPRGVSTTVTIVEPNQSCCSGQHEHDSNLDTELPATPVGDPLSEDPNGGSSGPEPNKLSANQLEDQFTNEKLQRLQAVFEEADEDGGGGLDMDEFRKAMRTTMGDHITDEQLDMIFMKVDTNCDGTVDWDEYLTYMLLECRERDQMQVQARQPFPRDAKVIHVCHKDTLVRAIYLPSLIQEDVEDDTGGRSRVYRLDENNGRYVSASKEGVIQFWTTDMKTSNVRRIEPIPPQKSIWVTDIVVMPRANVLVAGTTSGMLILFDMSGNRFERMSVITDLKGCPLSMSFWSHPSASARDPQLLIIGDDRGSVLVVRFKRILNKTHLNPKISRTGKSKFMMEELIRGGVKYVEVFHLHRIHRDAVRQVMYCPPLQCIFSCSKDQNTSMFVGDFERNTEGSYLEVKKGINTFDYCKKLNVIITGGYDTVVRVWNPYITTKPVITLAGHKSPVLHVMVNSTNEHVISIAENKDIRIHDMTTQTCIQTLFRKMLPNMGSQPISVAMFNERRQALMFGWKSLVLLQPKIKEIKELTTSSRRVTIAIYNPIFHQVVTGGVDSQVGVWDVHTGEKVMQFKAHVARKNGHLTDVEITAMAFGPRFRRLITAAQDGTVKIWNFNNGACLREIPVINPTEITSIVCTRERIATAGWSRFVTIFLDTDDDDSHQLLSPAQPDDILTLAHYPPHLLASASHDGTILVWSLETMRLVFFTQVGRSGRAQSYAVLERILEATPKPGEKNTRKPTLVETNAPNPTLPYTSVGKLIFLPERIHSKDTAILFAACSDGFIRAYSVHHEGGLKGQFQAPKRSGCPVNALVGGGKNNIIITGDNDGYIRVWDISHYCTATVTCSPESDAERIPYWKQFTYYNFQAEIAARREKEGNTTIPNPPPVNRPDPKQPGSTLHLINSFHAHLSQIICLDYAKVHDRELLVSCSSDLSVRLWTINGEFLGIFGQPTVWANMHSTERPPEAPKLPAMFMAASTRNKLIPPDVRRVASATTLRVLYGGKHHNWQVAKHILTWLSGIGKLYKATATDVLAEAKKAASLESLSETPTSEGSILGKSYKQQMRHQPLPNLGKVSMYHTQCRAYKSLPCIEMENLQLDEICDVSELKRIQGTYKLSPLKNELTMYNAFRKVAWVMNLSGPNKSAFDTKRKARGGSEHKKQGGGRKMSMAVKRGSIIPKENKSTNTNSNSRVPALPKLSKDP